MTVSSFYFHWTVNQKTTALKQKIKGNACCRHGKANIYVTQLRIELLMDMMVTLLLIEPGN